jgi:hypothetical protein
MTQCCVIMYRTSIQTQQALTYWMAQAATTEMNPKETPVTQSLPVYQHSRAPQTHHATPCASSSPSYNRRACDLSGLHKVLHPAPSSQSNVHVGDLVRGLAPRSRKAGCSACIPADAGQVVATVLPLVLLRSVQVHLARPHSPAVYWVTAVELELSSESSESAHESECRAGAFTHSTDTFVQKTSCTLASGQRLVEFQ